MSVQFLHVETGCIAPSSVPNGTLFIHSDGGNVDYQCDVGFSLHGDSMRSCTVDGSGWSGEQPFCGRIYVILCTLFSGMFIYHRHLVTRGDAPRSI